MNNKLNTPIVISGIGMVTPLGWNTDQVWQRLCAGESGILGTIESPNKDASSRCARVTGFNLDEIVRTPRTRRSSAISHFAVGATALALSDAKLTPHPRIGVIVAVSMGGVTYTRNFHHEFVQGGARNVSPMLFPETVFNAPASHISAVFGLTDVNYTVIGDGSCAASAVTMAVDYLNSGMVDQCLVVAAEEMEWITIEGFARFGLAATWREGACPMQPYGRQRKGFLGGEGAVALLLESGTSAAGRGVQAHARLASCDRGFPFASRREIPRSIESAVSEGLKSSRLEWTDIGGVIGSANGTFLDRVEAETLQKVMPVLSKPMPVTSFKAAIGESHTVSCLFKIAVGALALQHRTLPPTACTVESILDGAKLHLTARAHPFDRDALLLLCVGFNEQASVIVLAAV